MTSKIAAVFSMAALALSIFSSGGPALAETAENNYKLYCTQCHGIKGDGKGINVKDMSVQPKDHTNAQEMSRLKDLEMFQAIKNGGAAVSKSTLMPPWGTVLKDDEVNDLVKYLRKLCKC